MATTVGSSSSSSSNHHSPRGSGFTADGGGGVVRSPQFQQRRGLSAPWSEVVRGEPESIPAAVHISPTSSSSLPEKTPFTTDCSISTKPAAATVTVAVEAAASMDNPAAEECSDGHNGNAAQPKKPVWNKLPNGVKESGLPVMGAASWPALSECTRASSKSSAPDSSSSKTVSNGPISVSQGAVISNAPQKHTNSNPNPTSRHGAPGRQRSMKRGGGGNSGGRPAQSSSLHPPPPPPTPPPPPPFPILEGQGPPGTYGNFVQVLPIVPPREPPYPTRPIAGFAPSHAVNEHFSHRNPSRRPRGDGQYHNNPGGRREHDRRNPESNARSSNGRDLHMQHQRAPPRSFMRPPPPVSPAFLTPSVRPFASPMAFTEMRPPLYIIPPLHPESFRSMPFIAHAQPQMFIPISEPPPLPILLVKQIDYYFSDVNLERDIFLKSSMDEQGWVHISVIAAFPRVKSLTDDIHAILEALRTSMVVEVKDGKVRRRNEWMKYISSTGQGSMTANSQSLSQLGNNEMATTLQKLTLEEGSSNQSSTEASLSKCSSVESMDRLHPSNDEGTN